MTSAKRTNWILAALVLVVVTITGVAAGLQLLDADEPTAEQDSAPLVTPPEDHNGRRPAETSFSWFDHGFAVEQFDVEMTSLSCTAMAESITPDLCGVARSTHGAFLLLGTEGFWDPAEIDPDGVAWIPLDLTVFVMREDISGPLAISVMDGFTNKAYTDVAVTIDLYGATIKDDQVLVLHKRLTNNDADPFDYRESIQVLAMSPTGAPTVVATYEGHRLQVAATTESIELSSLRYRTSSTIPSERFFTRISLLPPDEDDGFFAWDEIVTTSTSPVPQSQAMTPLSSYAFPVFELVSNFSSAVT